MRDQPEINKRTRKVIVIDVDIQWFSNTKNKAKKINTLIVIAIVGW